MKYIWLPIIVSLAPLDASAAWVEYCFSIDGVSAQAKYFRIILLGKKSDAISKSIGNKECENFRIEDSRLELVVKKESVSVKGINRNTVVKYDGEKTPYRITIVLADIYIDGKIFRENVYLQNEIPTTMSEYEAAKRRVKEEEGREE